MEAWANGCIGCKPTVAWQQLGRYKFPQLGVQPLPGGNHRLCHYFMRCVCKAWCAIVDTRRLLLPDLLPHSVRGIFLMYHELRYPVFLSCPSTGPEISGKLDFLLDPDPDRFADVLDHCNGLLLHQDPHGLHVANPATRRWARLPPPPRLGRVLDVAHLVFDPTESPHCEVLLVPDNPGREEFDKKLRSSAADDTKEEECKDVVFLNVSLTRVVAYHLNSSMVQDLGNLCPKYYDAIAAHIVLSFPYAPCWMAEFPENNLEAHVED